MAHHWHIISSVGVSCCRQHYSDHA